MLVDNQEKKSFLAGLKKHSIKVLFNIYPKYLQYNWMNFKNKKIFRAILNEKLEENPPQILLRQTDGFYNMKLSKNHELVGGFSPNHDAFCFYNCDPLSSSFCSKILEFKSLENDQYKNYDIDPLGRTFAFFSNIVRGLLIYGLNPRNPPIFFRMIGRIENTRDQDLLMFFKYTKDGNKLAIPLKDFNNQITILFKGSDPFDDSSFLKDLVKIQIESKSIYNLITFDLNSSNSHDFMWKTNECIVLAVEDGSIIYDYSNSNSVDSDGTKIITEPIFHTKGHQGRITCEAFSNSTYNGNKFYVTCGKDLQILIFYVAYSVGENEYIPEVFFKITTTQKCYAVCFSYLDNYLYTAFSEEIEVRDFHPSLGFKVKKKILSESWTSTINKIYYTKTGLLLVNTEKELTAHL